MARVRTTKGLAKRISLDYFKKRHWLRFTKSWLSRGAALIGAIVGIAVIVGVAERMVSPGSVSSAHARFESDCSRCHGVGPHSVLAKASDQHCLCCHDGPVHHQNQRFTPACGDCHMEHSGRMLASVPDKACTRCHASLREHTGEMRAETVNAGAEPAFKCPGGEEHEIELARAEGPGSDVGGSTAGREAPTDAPATDTAAQGEGHGPSEASPSPAADSLPTSGSEPFDDSITDFSLRGSASSGHHPEFRPLRKGQRDPGHIKLNHHAHMNLKPGALKPAGLTKMECSFCHRPDTSQRLMAPINYEKHCAACHLLNYDAMGRFPTYPPGSVAPHDSPHAVRLFLNRAFTDAIQANAALLDEPDTLLSPAPTEESEGRIPGLEPTAEALPRAKTPGEWVARQVGLAERILYSKDCNLCHELAVSPAVARADGQSATAMGPTGSPTAESPSGAAYPGSASGGAAGESSARADEPMVKNAESVPAASSSADAPTAAADEAGRVAAAVSEDGAGAAPSEAWTPWRYPDTTLVPLAPNALPVVLPARIRGQSSRDAWLRHARFEHRTHRFVKCESCHTKAPASTLTKQVLIPGIETCADCHQPSKSRSDCSLCHIYHDKSRERPPRAPLTLDSLASAHRLK